MAVLQIKSIQPKGNNVYTVQAVVEDTRLVYSATYFEPAEYTDALCQADFCMADDASFPVDEDQLCDFIEELELSWSLVDDN